MKSQVENILEQWEIAARTENPAARNASKSEVRNALPEFVSKLAELISTTATSTGGERFSTEVVKYAKRHGITRAIDPKYSLDQVITEYRLLRRAIFRAMEAQEPLNFTEREKLLEAIDHGMVEAASEFAAYRGFPAARAETETARMELKLSQEKINTLEMQRLLRERFVSTLSHDLRTPLTAMKACAELLARQADKADLVDKLAARISGDAKRMDRMITDLLDANRIEAGEPLPLKIEECDLKEVVQETLDSLAATHGDRFSLHSSGNLKGYWSPHDIRRVIENLVLNALKYGDPSAKIKVTLRRKLNEVRIAVHNQGNPISPENKAILFQPFQRLLSAQQAGQEGWGLGLTLVRGIIDAHGGKVVVESTIERGTTFTIDLPRDSRPFQESRAA